MKNFVGVLYTTNNAVSAYQVFDKEEDAKRYIATHVGNRANGYTAGAVYRAFLTAVVPMPEVEWKEVK